MKLSDLTLIKYAKFPILYRAAQRGGGMQRGQFAPGPQLKGATKGVIKKKFGTFFIYVITLISPTFLGKNRDPN